MIRLDTIFLTGSCAPSSREEACLRRWFRDVPVKVSAICWAEFLCRPIDGPQRIVLERMLGELVPFSRSDGEMAADLFNTTRRPRGSLADCMIAATALAAGASVATSNEKQFSRFRLSGLQLAHW